MACTGIVYWHFFDRLEIMPPLLSGRRPYRYENQQNCCIQMRFIGAKFAKNAFAARALLHPAGEAYSAPPDNLTI